MIELNNISKRYKNNIALDNVSFNLEKNKVLGILGQNGAGKTTLMDIMCGCKTADSGSVSINNIELNKSPEKYKRQISYMPELAPLYKDMTVLEYLRFVAELKKLLHSEIPNHIDEILNLCSIYNVKNRLIANLSKGYRQRVGIAQALIGNAEVIVLDEPTVGLDPKQVVDILDLIKKLGKNHSILISSHRIYEIQAICDEYIILHKGLIKHRATIGETHNNKTKIQLLIHQDDIDIVDIIKSLPFVRKLSIGDSLIRNTVTLMKVIVECENEPFPEKSFNTIFASKAYYLYGMQRIEEDIEKIFLNLTKEQ